MDLTHRQPIYDDCFVAKDELINPGEDSLNLFSTGSRKTIVVKNRPRND